MTTCYGLLVDHGKHRRKLTPEECEQARAVQEALDAAAATYEARKDVRDATFRELYEAEGSPQSIGEAAGLDRTTVARIVRPGPNYRARYERKS